MPGVAQEEVCCKRAAVAEAERRALHNRNGTSPGPAELPLDGPMGVRAPRPTSPQVPQRYRAGGSSACPMACTLAAACQGIPRMVMASLGLVYTECVPGTNDL
jgi:hypothetical protein